MKFLLAIVALVACSVFASDASAQGGSVGTRTRVVVKQQAYVVRAVPVREYVTRTRRVWAPRLARTVGGSNGTNVSVQVGGSSGFGNAASRTAVAYVAPVANVSASVTQHTLILANRGSLRLRNGTPFHSSGPYEKGARFEGIGYSSRSAQEALEKCCYYGEKEIVEHYIARGQNGWYATARYR